MKPIYDVNWKKDYDPKEAAARFPSLSHMLKEFYDKHLLADPNYRLVEPRRVATPGGYLAFSNVATGLFFPIEAGQQITAANSGEEFATIDRSATTTAYVVAKSGVPVFYIPDAFASAVADTALPSDMHGTDLLWPHPGFVLGLSERICQDLFGISFGYIYVANMPAGEFMVDEWVPRLPIMMVTKPKFGFFFHAWRRGMAETFVGAYRTEDMLDQAISRFPFQDQTDASPEEVLADELLNKKVAAFIIKLLAILSTRPTLQEPGEIQRKAKHDSQGRIKHRELWSPNFIGRAWSVARQKQSTHESPSLHPRRAHITHQRIGRIDETFVSARSLPRRPDGEINWSLITEDVRINFWKCHKRIWIERLIVGAEIPE